MIYPLIQGGGAGQEWEDGVDTWEIRKWWLEEERKKASNGFSLWLLQPHEGSFTNSRQETKDGEEDEKRNLQTSSNQYIKKIH